MTSLLCVKQPGGTVQIHNDELIKVLETDTHENAATNVFMCKSEARPRKQKQKSPSPEAAMDSQSLIGQTMKVQDWLNEKTVKGLQAGKAGTLSGDGEKSDVESREARKLYNPLLETESTFVRDIDNFLDYKDLKELRKKEMLHKKWNDRVYEPLRKNIIEAMDGEDWPELDRRKRELHKQYLEFVNQKVSVKTGFISLFVRRTGELMLYPRCELEVKVIGGHVFLDTMDPEEYYAQALNGHRPAPIKVTLEPTPEDLIIDQMSTKALRDPLLSQGRQRSAEERTILRCITGYDYTDKDIEQVKLPPLPLVPLGRHGTDSLQWLRMPLHNIESTPRMASRRRMRGTFNVSHMDPETWEKTPNDTSQIDREMQIQRKRMFKEMPPFQKPRKQVVFRSKSASPKLQSIAVQTECDLPETIAVNATETVNNFNPEVMVDS